LFPRLDVSFGSGFRPCFAQGVHTAQAACYNAPMPRPRLQFRLSTLLWLTLAVACFLGGYLIGVDREKRRNLSDRPPSIAYPWTFATPDGESGDRIIIQPIPDEETQRQ
jgi:hypothetical protein